MIYGVAPGLRIEPVGDTWAAFSPLSGDTLVLSTEAVAVLEVLAEQPRTADAVARTLAAETGLAPDEMSEALRHTWAQFLAAGLILEGKPGEHNPG